MSGVPPKSRCRRAGPRQRETARGHGTSLVGMTSAVAPRRGAAGGEAPVRGPEKASLWGEREEAVHRGVVVAAGAGVDDAVFHELALRADDGPAPVAVVFCEAGRALLHQHDRAARFVGGSFVVLFD